MEGLRVVKLIAENVKGIKAIEIKPDSNFQVIAGKNGQGKTSVLDAIWLALAGGAASKSMARPVRDGSDGASVEIDMGEFVAKRKWTSNDKSTLQVISKDGAKYSSPQKMLDEMIGQLSFDPLEFSNLDTKKQLQTLLQMVDIDPTPIEFEKKKVFDERTIVNREVKSLKAQLDSFPQFDDNVPDKEIQSSDIIKEMSAAQATITENNELRSKYDRLGNRYRSLQQEIELDQEEIRRIEAQLASLKQKNQEKIDHLRDIAQDGSELQAAVQSLRDPDMSVFNAKLAEVDEVNKKIRTKHSFKEIEKRYKNLKKESEYHTFTINDLDAQKQKMMESAKFPIQGLSFDESGVLYNGVPFKQCSAAERLKVSMAMAMALNPRIKVIRILDGSLLDSDNMKLIREMATGQDFQVWVEQVDESGTVGIVIEDGMIKEINE